MNQNTVDVSRYIAEQPPAWRPTLDRLRALCRQQLVGYTEEIAYGLPSYLHDGQVEVAFGKRARYLSLYILKKAVLDAHRPQLASLSVGKGCIRYRQPEEIDWTLVTSLLAGTKATDAEICP